MTISKQQLFRLIRREKISSSNNVEDWVAYGIKALRKLGHAATAKEVLDEGVSMHLKFPSKTPVPSKLLRNALRKSDQVFTLGKGNLFIDKVTFKKLNP